MIRYLSASASSFSASILRQTASFASQSLTVRVLPRRLVQLLARPAPGRVEVHEHEPLPAVRGGAASPGRRLRSRNGPSSARAAVRVAQAIEQAEPSDSAGPHHRRVLLASDRPRIKSVDTSRDCNADGREMPRVIGDHRRDPGISTTHPGFRYPPPGSTAKLVGRAGSQPHRTLRGIVGEEASIRAGIGGRRMCRLPSMEDSSTDPARNSAWRSGIDERNTHAGQPQTRRRPSSWRPSKLTTRPAAPPSWIESARPIRS